MSRKNGESKKRELIEIRETNRQYAKNRVGDSEKRSRMDREKEGVSNRDIQRKRDRHTNGETERKGRREGGG